MMKSDPIKIFSRIHDVVAPLFDLVRHKPDIRRMTKGLLSTIIVRIKILSASNVSFIKLQIVSQSFADSLNVVHYPYTVYTVYSLWRLVVRPVNSVASPATGDH